MILGMGQSKKDEENALKALGKRALGLRKQKNGISVVDMQDI